MLFTPKHLADSAPNTFVNLLVMSSFSYIEMRKELNSYSYVLEESRNLSGKQEDVIEGEVDRNLLDNKVSKSTESDDSVVEHFVEFHKLSAGHLLVQLGHS